MGKWEHFNVQDERFFEVWNFVSTVKSACTTTIFCGRCWLVVVVSSELWRFKLGLQNCSWCSQVVVIRRWSLAQVWLYLQTSYSFFQTAVKIKRDETDEKKARVNKKVNVVLFVNIDPDRCKYVSMIFHARHSLQVWGFCHHHQHLSNFENFNQGYILKFTLSFVLDVAT